MVRSWSSARVWSLKPPASRTTSRRHAPIAPGTTVMQLSSAKARRSVFWLVMYSMACQRVTRLIRLPTLALPATAPTVGSASGATSAAMLPGGNSVSASRATRISPRGVSQPVVERARLAAVFLPEHPDVALPREGLLGHLEGAIRRAVVHDDDFHSLVVLRQQRLDRPDDDHFLAEGRDDHGDRRVVGRQRPVRPDPLDDRERQDEDQAGDAEDHCQQEEDPHGALGLPDRREGCQLHEPREPRAGRQRRHGDVPRHVGEIADRDEREASGPQRIDQRSQRRDGLAPVTATIVQQHDVASTHLIEGPRNDRILPRLLPVARIHMQPDRDVAQPLGDGDRPQLVGRGRLGVTEVGWTEERRAPAQFGLDQPLCGGEFHPGHRRS